LLQRIRGTTAINMTTQQPVMARAIYDFTGDPAVRQLSFKKNDVIKVTHQYENGWWAGEINGKIGYLPSTYIKLDSAGGAPASPAKPAPSPAARPSPPTPGGGKPSPTPGPAALKSPTSGGSPFTTMTSVTSSNPTVPVSKPSPPTPQVKPQPAPQPTTGQPRAMPSQPKPQPQPPAQKPPPSSVPPAKPQPAKPQPPQQQSRAPSTASSGSSISPGSWIGESNEADFNELDSLIKSLQDEVLDLKKLL